MAPDKIKKPFSKRHGYIKAKEIAIWEDAPEPLRMFVLDQAVGLGLTPTALRQLLCSLLRVAPDSYNWSDYPNVWNEVQQLGCNCDWYRFYDFIELLTETLGKRWPDDSSSKDAAGRCKTFHDAVNEFFVEEGIGWQMVDGEIITRGTETFESNIHSAVEALGAANRLTAQNEIHEAIGDLSRRPEADLTGAIQHAMAALECVARDVCGDEKATLGEVIKRYPNTIPKPLDQSIDKAWGFASEMARHIREGRNPERKEVELIVGLAATVATYLSR